jgi:hypothetical protein
VLRGRETGENSHSLFSRLSLTFSLTFLKKQKIKNRFGRAAEARAVYERAVEVLCASESDADGAAAARERALQGGEEEKPSDGVIVVYEDDPETAAAKKSSASSSTSAVSNASRLYLAFAAFEAMAGEPERARAIYRHALDKALKKDVETVFAAYSSFERSRGDREGVDAVVAAERRLQYEARVERDARDYDAWFEYARLEEGAASAELAEARASASSPESFNLARASAESPAVARVREVYERAVAALPPTSTSASASSAGSEKRLWCRYVYLWIYYAVFEELVAGDSQRAVSVYRAALGVRPWVSWRCSGTERARERRK